MHTITPLSPLIAFVIFFQGNIEELESLIEMKTGMMNYISKFWRGYYPLLLVEVQTKDSSFEDVSVFYLIIVLKPVSNRSCFLYCRAATKLRRFAISN